MYRFFSVDLSSEISDFGIVIFSSGHGGPSGTLVDESHSKAVIGYDFSVVSVDLMSDEFCTAFLSSWRGGDGRRSIAR